MIPALKYALIFLVFGSSCNTDSSSPVFENKILVKVKGHVLTRNELDSVLLKGLTPNDSLIAAESYINRWIKDVLMYDWAKNNLDSKKEIDRLVENYRKSLIIYQYQEQLITEKMSPDITEQEIQKYYADNKDKFRLETTLVKGLFIKIPIDAPQINKIKEWYKSSSVSDLENIEKYSIQNAVNYDYFYDRWVSINEIATLFPIHHRNLEMKLKQQRQIEVQDETCIYFLNVKDILLSGNQAPYEQVVPNIKAMLLNRKKAAFLRTTENDLYQMAEQKGLIERNY
jgi:hypothetical protein